MRSSALRFADQPQVTHRIVALIGFAHGRGFSLTLSAMRSYSASTSSSVTSMASAATTARNARSTLTARRRSLTKVVDQLLLILAGDLHVLLELDALLLDLLHEVVWPAPGSRRRPRPRERRRPRVRTEPRLCARPGHGWPATFFINANAADNRLAPRLDGRELATTLSLDPLVGDLGKLQFLHPLDGHLEVCRFVGARWQRGERLGVAGLAADQLLVEAGGNPALADFVQPVFGVQTRNRFAVAGRREVDRDLVAADGRSINVGQAAVTTQLRRRSGRSLLRR